MKVSLSLFVVFCAASCFASPTCQSTFSAGSGAVTIGFCVTANGNVYVTPQGMAQITEGYAVCVGNVGYGYYDLGTYGDSGNWQAPVITQPKGANTFPLSISRTSTDGLVTFNQTYKFANAGRSVHLSMTVDAHFQNGYTLLRFMELAPYDQTSMYSARTQRSAFAWSNTGITAVPFPRPELSAHILASGNPGNICTSPEIDSLPYNGASSLLLNWRILNSAKPTLVLDYFPTH